MLLEGRTLFGRKKIFCDEPVITRDNVVSVLKEALKVHWQNRNEIDYLYQYYCGNQPILARAKKIRPEICNKIVENRANEIVTFKTGYLCGEPIQYVSRGGEQDVTDDISNLNDMMLLCGKSAHDKELAEWMYICGTGYRMVLSNKDVINTQIVPRLSIGQPIDDLDEAPFNIYTLDPRNTFVVYHSGIGERPLMGVKYVIRKDRSVVYSVYTRNNYFEIIANNEYGDPQVYWFEDRKLDEIPIIEYPLNVARLGAFEIVLSLLDAINTVQSNRLDGIEQFIQSLLVLYNCEIEDEAAKGIREAGIIKLKGVGDNKADVKVIAEQLDQQQTQTLVDYMYQTVLNIVGMPNRNGGRSTSDTGSAVIMRDGWEAAEARAKSDELMFKESERKMLKLVLTILRATIGTSLRLADVEIKFTRRNYENLQSKSQVLSTLLQTGYCALEEAYAISGISPDPTDSAKRGEEWHNKVKAEQVVPINGKLKEGDAFA
jgi:SPP1 family phage portal protein